MLPPGLAFAALSDKAWARVPEARLSKFYFDFRKERKAIAENQSAYTPAVSLVVGLRESLRLILTEGLANVFARHDRLARATRAGVQALGLALFADCPGAACTAVRTPAGLDGGAVVKGMRKRGITIAGGQGSMSGVIFRISHMGYVDAFDILPTASGSLGSVVVSTIGNATVPGINFNPSGTRQDLLRCNITSLAPFTCAWSLYFDGSDVGLTTNNENVDGASRWGGDLFLSTNGDFAVTGGFSGAGNDVFACKAPVTEATTSAATSTTTSCPGGYFRLFSGAHYGLGGQMDALDLIDAGRPSLPTLLGAAATAEASTPWLEALLWEFDPNAPEEADIPDEIVPEAPAANHTIYLPIITR